MPIHAVFGIIGSAGAVPKPYDISSGTTQKSSYKAWVHPTSQITVQKLAGVIPSLISPSYPSDHHSIPNAAGTGHSPRLGFQDEPELPGTGERDFARKGFGLVVPSVDPPITSTGWWSGRLLEMSRMRFIGSMRLADSLPFR